MRKAWPPKDPSASKRYGFNWSPKDLGLDQITVVDATVVSGTVVHVSSVVGEVPNALPGQGTIHRFSGGTHGETCEILLEIWTDAGDNDQQTVFLPIRNQ